VFAWCDLFLFALLCLGAKGADVQSLVVFESYLGNPRSVENNPASRFCLAHFVNPKESEGFTSGARQMNPGFAELGGGNAYRIMDCQPRVGVVAGESGAIGRL